MHCGLFWQDCCKNIRSELLLQVDTKMKIAQITILLVFISIIDSSQGQSKKEQIAILNSRVDSFKIVVSTLKTNCSDNMDKLEGKIKVLEDELNRQQILFKNQTQELTETSQLLKKFQDSASIKDSSINALKQSEKSYSDSFENYKKLSNVYLSKAQILNDITTWKATYFEGEISDRVSNDTGGYFKIKPLTGEELTLHFRLIEKDSSTSISIPLHIQNPLVWERSGLKVRGYAIRFMTEGSSSATGYKATPANPKNQVKKEVNRLLYMETY